MRISSRARLARPLVSQIYFAIDRHELYGKVCGEWSLLHSVPLAPTSHPRSVWWGHFFRTTRRSNTFEFSPNQE
jgi:hypothetical protein